MKSLKLAVLFLILLSGAACAATVVTNAGPEPAPWWMQVEETQGLLMKWIGLLTAVGTAAVAAGFGLYMLILSKIKEIKERQDRQSVKQVSLQEQLAVVAKDVIPAKSVTPNVIQ